MGVKPFLVASSIQAIMAQRLIRVICPKCKGVDKDVDQKMIRMLGFGKEEAANATFYKGKGCENCHGTGYRGRQGIFELLVMNNELRELAFRGSTLSDLRQAAMASGMRNLLSDGRLKILHGITTAEEVLANAQAGELVLE